MKTMVMVVVVFVMVAMIGSVSASVVLVARPIVLDLGEGKTLEIRDRKQNGSGKLGSDNVVETFSIKFPNEEKWTFVVLGATDRHNKAHFDSCVRIRFIGDRRVKESPEEVEKGFAWAMQQLLNARLERIALKSHLWALLGYPKDWW